ncbi:class I SAM-dependent methyltransferase [Facklamia sp. DSM 111018]|uniref:Class I SAM-dependent methyltransferase n=1 Tax=Facklamia lactis TaxID=2749967 RepID=A0ABS0LTF4_9LACT|nr:class I SAM-dependent methyltransferase [Facklamia lactis]MBG9987309.1 class I SAM-dependent methyltransferase [Facklamia lactis]
MSKQNIYDDEIFFQGYKKIREQEVNANTLFEIPSLLSVLPELKGKSILDLGCGFGDHCKKFVDKGAKKVVGIDISKKMLEIASKENSSSKISYLNMPIESIETLNEEFDIVISSLAFHYVEDYGKLIKDIFSLLNEDGYLIFSQEHPLNTCHSAGNRWTKNQNGEKIYANLSNYGIEGERECVWFVDHVKKYHRTFSSIITTLIEGGFTIEKILEPLPDEAIIQRYPENYDLFHKPDFLIIKTKKKTL